PSAGAAQQAVEILVRGTAPLPQLKKRVEQLRGGLRNLGFTVLGGEHPLFAVLVGGVVTLQQMVNALFLEGVHVNGLCYPVVPEDEARIRLAVSAAQTEEDVARALAAFE